MASNQSGSASSTNPKISNSEPGLRVKLEASGISSSWKKQEVIGVIRQLSDDQADEQLRKRPTGSCILRIDDKVAKDEKTPLVVSYKYSNMTFHRRLKILLRVRPSKDNFLVCKTDAKTFKFLQSTLFPFLDHVTVFINEFCANKNFIEKELRDVDVERELTFRRFLVCPDYGPITLIKKAEEVKHGSKSVSVAIDFNECQFLVIKNSEVVNTVSSFNEILLDFLNIRAVDTFLVIRALGYNPQALKESVARDRSYSFAQTREFHRIDAAAAAMMSSKDKASMVAMIDEQVQVLLPSTSLTSSISASSSVSSSISLLPGGVGGVGPGSASSSELPDGLIDAVSTIQNAIQLLEAKPAAEKKWEGKVVNAERMQWVKHGIFLSLISLVCKVGVPNPVFKEIVAQSVDIIKMLMRNFPPACEAFYQTLWAHQQMSPGPETHVGISYLLSEVIATRPFSQIFLAESGVAKMLDLYNSISAIQAKNRESSMRSGAGGGNTGSGSSLLSKPSAVGRMLRSNSIFGSKPTKKSSVSHDSQNPDNNNSSVDNADATSGGSSGQHSPKDKDSEKNAESSSKAEKRRRGRLGSTPQKMNSAMIPRPHITKSAGIVKISSKDDSVMSAGKSNSATSPTSPKFVSGRGGPGLTSDESDSGFDLSGKSKVPRLQLGLSLGGSSTTNSTSSIQSGRRVTGRDGWRQSDATDEGGLFARLKELIAAKEAATGGGISLEDTSFIQERLPSEELRALAKKLGETYMTNDLATILPYKEYADARTQRKRQRNDAADDDMSPVAKQALELFRVSPVYLVKCHVLKTLASLAEEPQFKQYARNPMNLLFSELTQSYKDNMLRDDPHYRGLIFKILQQSADDVEVFYSHFWTERTKDMPASQLPLFRKRLDLFVWRIHTRIISTLETKNFEDLEIHLAAMADYLKNCYSRVLASQIVDVCMETLLTIKSYIFKRKIDLSTFRNAKILHLLLAIFDEIAMRNKFDPLNDLLATFFLYKEDSWDFVKNYAYQVLGSRTFESKILEEYPMHGKQMLRDWRLQVMRHYRVCLDMIANHFRSDALAVDQLKMRLLKKMQFLVYPSGLIQHCLSEGSQYHNFLLKKEMLKFLHKLFSIKHCPFVRSKTYIDSYIGFHYMQFIKLYNNYALDQQTLELCRRHLKILIDFALQKNEEIRLKFYQLRAMEFLVREINLEYEIKVKGKRYQEIAGHDKRRSVASTMDSAPATRGPIQLPSGLTLRPIALLMQGELEQREMSANSVPDASTSPNSPASSAPGSEHVTPANSFSAISPLKSPSGESLSSSGPLHMSSLPGATVLPGSAFLEDLSESSDEQFASWSLPPTSALHTPNSEVTQHDSLSARMRGRSNTLGSSPWEPPPAGRASSISSIGSNASVGSTGSQVPKLNLNTLIAARAGKVTDKINMPSVLDKVQDPTHESRKKSFAQGAATGSTAALFVQTHIHHKEKLEQPHPHVHHAQSSLLDPVLIHVHSNKPPVAPDADEERSESGRARAKSVDYTTSSLSRLKSPGKRQGSTSSQPDPLGRSSIIHDSPVSGSGSKGSPRAGSLTRTRGSGTDSGRNSPMRKRPQPIPMTEDSAVESAYDTMDEAIKLQIIPPTVVPPTIVSLNDSKHSEQKGSGGGSSSLKDSSSSLAGVSKGRRMSNPTTDIHHSGHSHSGTTTPTKTQSGEGRSSRAPSLEKPPTPTGSGIVVVTSSSSNNLAAPASSGTPGRSPGRGGSLGSKELPPVPELSTPNETPRSEDSMTTPEIDSGGTTDSVDSMKVRHTTSQVSTPTTKSVPKLSLGTLSAQKGSLVKPASESSSVDSNNPTAPAPAAIATPDKPKLRLSNEGTPVAAAAASAPSSEEKKPPAIKKALPSLGLKIGALSLQKGELLASPATPEPAAAPAPVQAATEAPAPAAGGAPKPAMKKIAIPPVSLGALKLQKEGGGGGGGDAAAGEPNNKDASSSSWAENNVDPKDRPLDRRMTLTALERGTSKAGKLQILLNKKDATGNAAPGKTDSGNSDTANTAKARTPITSGDNVTTSPNQAGAHGGEILQVEERLYANERDNRKLYADDRLHEAILELIFFLLIAPNGFTLESLYTHQYPMTNVKMNVPFIMGLHLAHPMNKKVLGPLAKRTQRDNESAFRLLRLLSMRFFQPSLYKDLVRIAEGAYGTVYASKLLGDDVAVKLMSVPRSIHDRCVLHDIFTEILVLDKWKADERICKMIDYGVDNEHYWIVMKRYKTSLRSWRVKQTASLEENLPLYLNIFSDVLNCVNFLAKNPANIGVNHYDIKCDNFLINPIDPNISDEDFNNPKSDTPPFLVCLADFGESIVYTNEREAYTIDNRGTEFIKSPEMLTIAYASNQERQTYDRRKKVGASTPSDIWSIGCLLYELLTGEFLFYDEDWVRFWLRVTTNTQDLISEKKKEAIHHNQPIINFLQWVLIRDPAYRPTYHDLITRFSSLKQEVLEDLRRKRAGESTSPKSGTTSPDSLLSPTESAREPKSPKTPKTPKTPSESARGLKSFRDEPDSARALESPSRTSARRSQMARQMSEAIPRPQRKKAVGVHVVTSPGLDLAEASPREEGVIESAREGRKKKLRLSGEKKRRSSIAVVVTDTDKIHLSDADKDKTPRSPKTTRESTASPRDSASSKDGNESRRKSMDATGKRASVGAGEMTAAELKELRQQVLAITGGGNPGGSAQSQPVSSSSSTATSTAESTDTESDNGNSPPESPSSPHSPNSGGGNSSDGNYTADSPHMIRLGVSKKGNRSQRGPKTHQRAKTTGVVVPPLALGLAGVSPAAPPAAAVDASANAPDAGIVSPLGNGAAPSPSGNRSNPPSAHGVPGSAKTKVPPLALNLGGMSSLGSKALSPVAETLSSGGDTGSKESTPSSRGQATPTGSPKKPAIPRLSLQLGASGGGSSTGTGSAKPAIPALSLGGAAKEPAEKSTLGSAHKPGLSLDLGSIKKEKEEITSPPAASVAAPAVQPAALTSSAAAPQSVMVDKPKVLTQHDLPSLLSMPHFDQGELGWYSDEPSQIYSHIWLGSYDCTQDKNRLKHKYGITHVINCSNKPNLHPMHFRYEQLIVGDNAETPITSQVSKILIFVREAEKMKGRVLITEPNAPDTSIGAALAVALVMKLSPKKLSFYESYRLVNAKRYISWIHPQYIQQLCEWNFARFVDLKKNYRQAYQCICGNNSWTMLQPFDSSASTNPMPCSCSWDVTSSCPNIDCQGFLDDMAQFHNFKSNYVLWGYTSFENVIGDFDDTDEFSPSDKFSFQQREQIEEKEWKLFRCRRCNFITHAIRASNPNIVAVVANIPVAMPTPSITSSQMRKL